MNNPTTQHKLILNKHSKYIHYKHKANLILVHISRSKVSSGTNWTTIVCSSSPNLCYYKHLWTVTTQLGQVLWTVTAQLGQVLWTVTAQKA